VPLHWHETHDEIFRVLKGEIEVTVGSSVKLYRPEDGEVRIPKGIPHSLKTYPGVECIVEERTDPMVIFMSIEILGADATCLIG
jgi:mannose-6-phosphate isomerase-like protein (cupin superfamily)